MHDSQTYPMELNNLETEEGKSFLHGNPANKVDMENFHRKNLTLDLNDRYLFTKEKKGSNSGKCRITILAILSLLLIIACLIGYLAVAESAKDARCKHLPFLVVDVTECREAAKLSE